MLYDFSKTKEADRVREAARISYGAFLEAIDEYTRVEWVDGEAEFMSPVALIHLRIGQFLLFLIYEYVNRNPIGEVIGDGFQMKLGAKSSRVPDILFLLNEHRDRLHDTYLDGPADLVVEVVSPDSVKRDRERKFREYAQAGIPEFWLIDTLRGKSEFYLLDADKYRLADLNAAGLFESVQLPGLRINPEWLTRDPLPTVRSVLVDAGIAEI